MTIFVDKLRYHKYEFIKSEARKFGSYWCHLSTSEDDKTELHEFAKQLGLSRRYFQNHPTVPHYDLTQSKRALAVTTGAIEVTSQDLVRMCSSYMKNKANEKTKHTTKLRKNN